MQKKIVLIVVLLTLIMIEPVIATPRVDDPKIKIAITDRVLLVVGSSSLGEQVTENGILYVKDAVSTGYIEADVDSAISGTVWTNLSGTLDLNTLLGSFNGKWVITNDKGTFEGSVTGVVAVATVSGKFSGMGAGGLEGQKIRGSFEGAVNNYIVDLTLDSRLTSKKR